MASGDWEALDDDALALRARNEPEALDALLQRSAPLVARTAYSILGRHEDALDAAQVALTRIAGDLQGLWSGKSYRAWLFSYARSAAIDLRRKNAGAERIARRLSSGARKVEERDMPDTLAEREEMLAALREELAELPEETAVALTLYHLDGLTVVGVAGQIGLSVDACKQRLSRGRESLRERLERRGLAPEGAALAVTAGIETVFSSAKAWAGSVAPAAYAKLVRMALSSGIDHAPARASTSPNTPLAATASHDRFASAHVQDAVREPMQRTRKMFKAYLLVLGGLVLLGATGLVAFKSHAARELEATRLAGSGKTTALSTGLPALGAPVSDSKAGASESKAGAESRGTPQWQTPRFIDGNYHPLSISVYGSKVVLLTAERDSILAPTKHLVLFESNDNGQSWAQSATLDGYLSGYGDFDQTSGDYALLGLTLLPDAPDAALNASRKKMLTPLLSGSESELRVRKAGGGEEFGKPVQVWASEGSDLLQGEPRLFCAGGGMWGFQPRCVERTDRKQHPNMIRMRVAHADRGGSLTATSGEWNIPGRGAPVAWAKDNSNAGFVTRGDLGGLLHYVTRDGGKSWQSSIIPFNLDLGSEAPSLSVNPSAITRDGDTLLLLVFALFQPKGAGAKDIDNIQFQRFTLVSSDLGKTWGAPCAASVRDDRVAEGDGVHILDGQMVMCEKSSPGFKADIQMVNSQDFSNKSAVNVRVSNDGGKSWYNHHAFAQLSDRAEQVVMGGNRETLHVAIYRGASHAGSNETGCLIIRSFSNGTWNAPKTPAPSWFKDEQLPGATKEDF